MPTFDDKTRMLMIDLETRSTNKKNASIAQIGAAIFTISDGFVGEKFLMNLADDTRFHVSEDTMLFWKKQPMSVRESVFSNPTSVNDSILSFDSWLRSKFEAPYKTFVWSHGKEFDFPILENAYEVVGLRFPLGYPYLMDTRTIFNMANIDHKQGNNHNAVDDCLNQIECLRKCL